METYRGKRKSQVRACAYACIESAPPGALVCGARALLTLSDRPPASGALLGANGDGAGGVPLVVLEGVACGAAKQLLHVQSISEWAPRMIGPYCQMTAAHGASYAPYSAPVLVCLLGTASALSA